MDPKLKYGLKRLSHEMDLAFDDIYGLFEAWIGDGASFLIFLLLRWFYNAKSVFLAVNASLGWLNNVWGLIRREI